MLPFKDADKHGKVFIEKSMDIVALFLLPLSYVIFQDSLYDGLFWPFIYHSELDPAFRAFDWFQLNWKILACMIDFMYALSTLTNQAEVWKNTQKSALNCQLKDDVATDSNKIGKLFNLDLLMFPRRFKI